MCYCCADSTSLGGQIVVLALLPQDPLSVIHRSSFVGRRWWFISLSLFVVRGPYLRCTRYTRLIVDRCRYRRKHLSRDYSSSVDELDGNGNRTRVDPVHSWSISRLGDSVPIWRRRDFPSILIGYRHQPTIENSSFTRWRWG